MNDHASFFSGAGGLDLGLERAGWRTVSFSEIDPYASAVLAERWPGVPNLGDIVQLASRAGSGPVDRPRDNAGTQHEPDGWHSASLWSGGFPCQDLSVAGKRRGMGAGTRSGLAFSFLELVGRHRPRFVLLENVPGLLSSHGGKDFGTLLSTLVELGYGVGYRVLDARYFGVPQRRRRVFILGVTPGGRAGAELAAEVLSVGSRCRRHPPTGIEAGEGVAAGARPGVDIARAVTGTSGKRHDDDTDTLIPDVAPTLRRGAHGDPGIGRDNDHDRLIVRPSPDSRGVRASDGLAGRSHDRLGVADTLRVGGRASGAGDSYDNTPWVAETLNSGGNSGGFRTEPGAHLVTAYTKSHRASSVDDGETWVDGEGAPTLNDFDVGDTRAVSLALRGRSVTDDPLLPLGLDSHRYRCCGNGVVADVGEWIGRRLLEVA